MSVSETSDIQTVDVVIPYHTKDSDIVEMCLAGCLNISNIGNIYVITGDTDCKFGNVQIIDENKLFDDGLLKSYVESRLSREHPDLVWRSGWLFQQFIKMGCSYALENLSEYYLVVDSDVVFLKKIGFFKEGRMLLTLSEEFHGPHFNCCEALLGERVNREHIFVAHHMLICKSIMLELLHSIEKRFKMKWYDAILECIDTNKGLVFSEYETYGHYLENNHPRKIALRKLRNVQSFRWRYLLQLLLGQTDYATIHNYKKPSNNPKTNPWIYKLFLSLVDSRLKRQQFT